jgi:hypothetical protein
MAHLKITFWQKNLTGCLSYRPQKGQKGTFWVPYLRSNIPRSALCTTLDTYDFIFSGNLQNFIHGTSSFNHFCECAASQSCAKVHLRNPLVCNCDANYPTLAKDLVLIVNKNVLPIHGITYGPLLNDWQKMAVSIGPLKCSGLIHLLSLK